MHFQQGIPCLLFDELFTDAASWLGILRQRQEHGVRWRFMRCPVYNSYGWPMLGSVVYLRQCWSKNRKTSAPQTELPK
jgi:hypothetical protein